KATQLLSWIHQVFGVRLLLRDIFTYNTIRDLCRLIDQSARTSYEAITPLAAMEYYELSHAQKQLWVLDQMTENQVAYNIPGAYWFKGALNRDAFEKTIATLIERHESLRTTFVSIQGEPKQRIQSAEAFLLPLEYIDLRKEVNPAERARGIADSEAQKPFDLEKGPLIRVKLVHLEEEAYVFVFVMHHIISDGWSMEVLKQELLTLYQAYVSGQSNPLPPLRVQYKDYAAWHNTHLSGTPLVAHQTYWLNQFQGEIPVLNLPTDFPRPSIKSFKGAIKRVALGKALSEGMNQYSQEKGVSLFMTLQALLKALMHRYTGQEDIVIGSVEAGRSHHSLENQIGYYLNTVALRTRFEGAGSFDDLLMAVKETTLATFEHHLYPFDALVKELGVDRDMSRTPLFDISMSLQNLNIAEAHPDGLDAVDVSDLEIDLTISKFDLNFVFIMVEDGLLVQAEYCTDLFTSERIDHLVGHLQGLIQAVLTDSSVPVNKLDYLPATEKQQLTLGFNDTARDFPDHLTMPEVFEQMVALYPSNQAVVIHEQAFTYQEINEAANQLAHYLRETYQIVPDEAIGLMVNRSERLIIGILGILKAGGAYLPIDPDYPEDRKAYILADAKVRILLTEMDYLFSVPSFEGELAALDVQLPGLTTSKANPARLATPENLAYLIYTSGSTGKPKGVMVEHRGNVNMALDQIQRFGVGEEDKVLQFASCSFDASVYEIFMALYAGATLVLLDKPLINDPALFVDYLQAKGVTVVTLPPVYLATLNKTNLDFLGVIITAGEAANVSDAIACSEFSTYYNAYGPTEASVCVTTYQVTEADQGKPSIPVGYPISNTQIYLLDAQGELVPLGIEGEICIAGAGLARGYVSNSALTDTHFKEHAQLQTRYYRTGDIGKRLASGAIEFIGRRDSQLKVRGYRIEPGEIVALIASQPGVQDAYILPRGSKASGQTLTAIVIPDRSFGQFGIGTPEASALLASVKEACKAALPSYMVPSAFRVMADLPLTTHGKVDKEALLQLEETILDEEAVYIAPATSLEKQLVSIWEEILDRSPIGMRDNFFELGGHSLKATQVVSRIHQETGAKIELGSIFNRPTIEELAELILKSETSIRFESIPAAAQQAYYPLSQAQRRLWVLNQMEENQLIYNIPTAYLLQGDLNISAFQQAFHAIVARYEILRTTFLFSDHEPQQQVHAYDSFGLQLAVQDLRGADNPEAEAKAQSEQESNIPFDLEKGPLLRAKLLQLADQRSLFLLTFHHIITDGWSIELLTNELLALYNTFLRGEENPLPELSIQYKDYCVWQHEQLKGEHFKKLQTYWLTQLSGQIPVLELPTDKKRPEVKTFHGEQVELVLDPTLVQRLKAISQEHDASLFIALLSSVYAFLSRYSGQKDMVLGTALAGRPHQDLEKQVGFFINTLALRNEIKETDTFSSLLKRVRENTLSAFEHQEYPFDRLVNELDLSRDVSRHPLFDVLVESSSMDIYQQPRQEMEGLSVEPFHADSLISKFDLSFRFNEQSDNRLALRLEFNTDLFAKSWIDRMLAHYQILLQSLTEAFHQPLFSLPFYAKEELQLVYGHWTEKKLLPIPPHTILDLWAQQLQINPQAAAIRFGKDVLTYQEVEASANRLAHHLITTAAVASDDVIGLLARRSPNVIIAMLGILKAGASFLPIDPQMPTGRIGYMLSEVKVKMLLLDSEFLADIDAYYQGSLFALDIQLAGLDESDITPVTLPTPQQLAYVIYTSGSTGKPKAVGVEHSNLYHYITWANEYYFGNLLGHPFALFTSLSFDLTITSIFSTLTRGDALSILEEKDVHELLQEQFGETSQVNAVKMTPSHVSILEQLALSKTSVSTVILGGEQVKQTHVQTLRRLNPAMKIYNEYGPTETTVGCSIQELVGDEELINIGKPIINTDIFIVDDQLNLLPAFIPGELCIGGIGVARGYLNNAEQSAQKFIINPHVAGQRIYRTGDVGYWLPNGEIVLKGRTDEQVKIRGNRIELGEIAHLLSENEQVRDAFVHTVGEGEAKQLVAYVVGSPDLQETALRAYLEQRLPAYMVPQYILILDTFKLNSNGKIDRQALPVPDSRHINALAYVAPRTPTEEKLVEIWQEVLEKSPIGIHDNLFVLGGHSLKAIMIVSRIQKELGAKIDLGILFSQPTIAGLSDEIAHTGSEAAAAIVPLPWQEYYDVSNAQRRLWVLNQLEDDLTAYNIPTAVV
ncbi:MAG: amino acid adenylation domain-containing protein, partial [Bacteroidota bacterium]